MSNDKEREVVCLMIKLYCERNHSSENGLCDSCLRLSEYVDLRITKCPHSIKPFCSNCSIHCYNKSMKAEIKKVMSYAGPRMILYHPIIAIRHLVQTVLEKRRINRNDKSTVK